MASLLSIIPFAARGPAQIFIFDIHALQERFYFSDQVIPRYAGEWERMRRWERLSRQVADKAHEFQY